MMMNIRGYLDSLNLRDDESKRMACPSCGSKNTFTATKEMGQIKYNCYKLDCSIGGYHNVDMTAAEIKILLSKREAPIKMERETMEIPEYVVQPSAEHDKYHKFVAKWGIGDSRLLYDVKDERVVFPIYHKGRIIDANGRAVGNKQPKWYRYTGAGDYFFVHADSETLIIVEDCVSALVIKQLLPNANAMAILGTSLTDRHMEKIAEYNNIIVALDPDAAHKTLQFSREIHLWTGAKTIAFNLDDDIKYKVDNDIERLREVTRCIV